MNVDDLDFELPEGQIAQRPRPRGESRLMILDQSNGNCRSTGFSEFPELLREGDLLVVNDTRVLAARLHGTRRTDGRKFELLLVRPLPGHPDTPDLWEAMVRPARRLRVGDVLDIAPALSATVDSRPGGRAHLAFFGEPVRDILAQIGEMPLPPYIRRTADDADRDRYQTIFAREPGAVAAPTAGLHFSKDIVDRIQDRGIRISPVTLHVGPGTFRPVTTSRLEDHPMETEWYRIPLSTSELFSATRAAGGRIVAVGTTAVRTLESAVSSDGRSIRSGDGETALFLKPGDHFRAVDALLTNFHLPRSTLLALVAAFAGLEPVLAAYHRARREGFLFYSYGDAMFIT